VWIEAGSFDLSEDDTSRAVERFAAGETVPTEDGRSLRAIDPRLAEPLRRAARLLAEGRPEPALTALEQAQELDPYNRMIRSSGGRSSTRSASFWRSTRLGSARSSTGKPATAQLLSPSGWPNQTRLARPG
jgi:hypothetical protein